MKVFSVRDGYERNYRGLYNFLLVVYNRNVFKRNKEWFEFVGVLDIEIGILFIINEELCFYYFFF